MLPFTGTLSASGKPEALFNRDRDSQVTVQLSGGRYQCLPSESGCAGSRATGPTPAGQATLGQARHYLRPCGPKPSTFDILGVPLRCLSLQRPLPQSCRLHLPRVPPPRQPSSSPSAGRLLLGRAGSVAAKCNTQ